MADAVVMDITRKDMEIWTLPWSNSEKRATWVYTEAFVENAYFKFFSKKATYRPGSLLRLNTSMLRLMLVLCACAAIILLFYVLQERSPARSSRFSSAALFLHAMILGRTMDWPPLTGHFHSRLLLGVWCCGMFFLSAIVQSKLTSEKSVPTLKRAIETRRQLKEFVDTNRVLPCTEPYMPAYMHLTTSTTGITKKLGVLLRKAVHGNSGKEVFLLCSTRIRRGTHVGFTMDADSYVTPPERDIAADLVPGKDHLGVLPRAFFVSKASPYKDRFRNLVMMIRETGLADALLRSNTTVNVDSEVTAVKTQFGKFAAVYIGGCILSIAVAITECLLVTLPVSNAVSRMN